MIQVRVRTNLAGCMTGHGQQHVFGMYAFSVVRNADQVHAAVDNVDFDACRESVHAVFEQFFDDASWPFNNFACRDAVDDVSIQLLNT